MIFIWIPFRSHFLCCSRFLYLSLVSFHNVLSPNSRFLSLIFVFSLPYVFSPNISLSFPKSRFLSLILVFSHSRSLFFSFLRLFSPPRIFSQSPHSLKPPSYFLSFRSRVLNLSNKLSSFIREKRETSTTVTHFEKKDIYSNLTLKILPNFRSLI